MAKVDAARELTDDGKVDALADLGLQGGLFDQGLGGEEARPQVAESAHFLTQFEEALFRADGTSAPFGATNGAEEDGISAFGFLEGVVGKWLAGGIDGGL